MKKIINKLKKNSLFMFVLGITLCSGIVYGANLYKSKDIQYSPTDSSWEVGNVSEAINSLYSMKNELDNIKSIGDATASDILEGKTAVVQGKLIEGIASSIENYEVDILATNFSNAYYDNGNRRLDIVLNKEYKFIIATGLIKKTYAVGGVFYSLASGTVLYSNNNSSDGNFEQIVFNMKKGTTYSIGVGNDGTSGPCTLSVIGLY